MLWRTKTILRDVFENLGSSISSAFPSLRCLEPGRSSAIAPVVLYSSYVACLHREFISFVAHSMTSFGARTGTVETDKNFRKHSSSHRPVECVSFPSYMNLCRSLDIPQRLATRVICRRRRLKNKEMYGVLVGGFVNHRLGNAAPVSSKCLIIRGSFPTFTADNLKICAHLPSTEWLENDFIESYQIVSSRTSGWCAHSGEYSSMKWDTSTLFRVEWTPRRGLDKTPVPAACVLLYVLLSCEVSRD